MSLGTRQARIHGEQLPQNEIVVVTATTKSMGVQERFIRCDTTSNAITLTLPPVGAAKGMTFSIWMETDGGNDVTIAHKGDSIGWSNITMADANDRVLMYSDGLIWWQIGGVGV